MLHLTQFIGILVSFLGVCASVLSIFFMLLFIKQFKRLHNKIEKRLNSIDLGRMLTIIKSTKLIIMGSIGSLVFYILRMVSLINSNVDLTMTTLNIYLLLTSLYQFLIGAFIMTLFFGLNRIIGNYIK